MRALVLPSFFSLLAFGGSDTASGAHSPRSDAGVRGGCTAGLAATTSGPRWSRRTGARRWFGCARGQSRFWRRCGAPGLAPTSYSSMLPGRLQRPYARPPLPLPWQPGINARPGRRSGARDLSEGPRVRNRLRRFAWMTGEVGRVRRTVGPRGSYAGPGPQVPGPCRLTRAELAPAEGTGRAGAGAGWRVYPDGLCERAEARRASMAVHYF